MLQKLKKMFLKLNIHNFAFTASTLGLFFAHGKVPVTF